MVLSFAWFYWQPQSDFMANIQWNWQVLWLGLGGASTLLSLSALAIWLIPGLRKSQAYIDREIFSEIKPSNALYLGVLTGVSEEIFFRGVLQFHLGLVVASILFGLVHLPGLRYWQHALWAGLMGLFLGGLYLWSENLLAIILIHTLNNAIAVFMWPRIRALFRYSEYQEE